MKPDKKHVETQWEHVIDDRVFAALILFAVIMGVIAGVCIS